MDEKNFYDYVIARSDQGDCYDCSGYLAVVEGDKASIARFGHCSCYGTWEALADSKDQPTWDWTGSISELVSLAQRCGDPDMPSRSITPADSDHELLAGLYTQIIQWSATRGRHD